MIDYDIHGLVGIRLINASERDAFAVSGQLGPLQNNLERDPDIIVRFVEHLPVQRLQFVDVGKTGFTEDGFFVLNGKDNFPTARIPFEQIGGKCEILCKSGSGAVPFLLAILNLTALKRDCVSLHASAFVHQGVGVLVTGWSKGGKTEALLAFSAQGARYVGDEWVLLSGDGRKMYGIPENIRIWDWHLQNLPHLKRQISNRDRLFFSGFHALDRMQKAIPNENLRSSLPLLSRAMPILRRKLNVRLSPQAIFENPLGPFVAEPEKLFLMMSQQSSSVHVAADDPSSIAECMAASIRFEQMPLMASYLSFKFAFPGVKNRFLEHAHELQEHVLHRALAGKEAFTVRHPYPVSFSKLYEAMRPFVEPRSRLFATVAVDPSLHLEKPA